MSRTPPKAQPFRRRAQRLVRPSGKATHAHRQHPDQRRRHPAARPRVQPDQQGRGRQCAQCAVGAQDDHRGEPQQAPDGVVGRGVEGAQAHAEHAAAEGGQGGSRDEGQEFQGRDLDARRGRALFVVAQGGEGAARAAPAQGVGRQQRGCQEGEFEDVVGAVAVEAGRAGQ